MSFIFHYRPALVIPVFNKMLALMICLFDKITSTIYDDVDTINSWGEADDEES